MNTNVNTITGTEPEPTKVNCLTFIDGIISSLARGGPGREGILAKDKLEILKLLPEWRDFFFARCSDTDWSDVSVAPNGGPAKRQAPEKWKVLGECPYEALYFARALYEVLFDNIPSFISLPLESLFSMFFIVRTWQRSCFVSYAKYCTVWPLARFLQQVLPKVPQAFAWNPLLFTGSARRILKNRLVSFTPSNLRLFNTYLQGVKRGCAVVDDSYILSSLRSHQIRMTAKDPMTEEFEDSFHDYCLRMIPNSDLTTSAPRNRKVSKKDRDGYALRGVSFEVPRMRLLEASPSAAFEAARSEGGGRDFIRSDLELDLLKMVETAPSKVSGLIGKVAPTFKEAVSTAMSSHSRGHATVSAVLEPLKVRLITKGSAHCQWVSRFFQKGLWGYLQKYPQFALTGRPLDNSDLSGIILRERKVSRRHENMFGIPLWDKPSWVSGDFSAATDGMSISATKALLETFLLASQLPEDVESVLRSVLYEQRIHYPKRFTANSKYCSCSIMGSCAFCRDPFGNPLLREESVEQTNGQLMGSVLSFPILCLTNLICYWVAFERRFNMKVRVTDLPVLVNGDDILFRADDHLYEIWQDVIKQCGFELSLGKNYYHESVLMVNSELFIYSENSDSLPHFRKIPFFNVGLLTGQSKITGREEVRMIPLPAIWNEIVEGASDQTRALSRFIHYQRSDVARWTDRGNYNLFVPVWRGGLGMIPPSITKFSFEITSFQQRFASLVRRRQLESYESGKLPSGLACGIVRELEGEVLRYRHFYHLREVQYGPLLCNQFDPVDTDVGVPILADIVDPDPQLRLRLPKNLGEIRSKVVPRMSYEDMIMPAPRLVEESFIEIPKRTRLVESHKLETILGLMVED